MINHSKHIARFGAMHLIATSLYFWFFSIVEEYKHAELAYDLEHGHLTEHDNLSLVVNGVSAVTEAFLHRYVKAILVAHSRDDDALSIESYF